MKDKEEKSKKTKKKVASKETKVVNPDDQEVQIKEIIVEKKVGFNYLEVIIIMVIAILFGGFIGGLVTFSKTSKVQSINKSKHLEEFVKTYQDILDNYYQKLDEQKLLDAGIEGMMEYLDDNYSAYMDQNESISFNEQVDGNYSGIGAEITLKDGIASITYLFEDSPASKAGLQLGDVLQKINDTNVENLTITEISALIKGSTNTTVKIQVKRNDQLLDFEIKRAKVELTSVTSKIYDNNIGYLKLNIFAANTEKQLEKELNKLEKENIKSLIIDVRDNPGGHLSQVEEILSLFIEKGKILYQIETKGIKEATFDTTKTKRDYPIVVLTNQSSASASEILAVAMKEVYGATLVGMKTFGKGTVQHAYELSSGATIKYTTQLWLTPNGDSIDKKGVNPDIEVELDEGYYTNPIDTMDNQLQMAIKVLNEK